MDLDRDARRVLELARMARTPSAADKAQVERGLTAALGVTALGVGATTLARQKALGKLAVALSGTKWWIASAALLCGTIAGVGLATRSEQAVVDREQTAAPHATASEPASPMPGAGPASGDVLQPSAAVPSVPPLAAAARPRSSGTARGSVNGPARLALELDLLHRAQSAWRAHEPAKALGLVAEHRVRFPQSVLRSERDALQVLALCEQGERAAAVRLARALLARTPRTPLRASLEASCAFE